MFIEVKKIEMQFLSTADGSVVKNPVDKKKVHSKPKIVKETVRIDEIKSFRPYHKNDEDENLIDGPICLIYFKKENSNQKDQDNKGNAVMKVNESYDSLNNRLSAIRLNK